MRDQKDRPLPALLIERLEHGTLVQGIEVRRRLIEEHERRIVQEGTGKPQALALAAGERIAELAYLSVEALGQAVDEIEDGRLGTGALQLLLYCIGLRNQQVLPDAVMEEHGILLDGGLEAPEMCGPHPPDIVRTNRDPAFIHIPEAHEEMAEGRLA